MSRIQYVTKSKQMQHWEGRIGRLVINFSALEFESIHWLVQLSEGHDAIGSIAQKQFVPRTTEIMRYVEQRSVGTRWRKETLREWNRALKLAKIRNRVAHNPVLFGWNASTQNGEPDLIGIPSARDPRFPAKEVLLSPKAVDHAVEEALQVVQKLETLRKEWCQFRDNGLAPGRPLQLSRWRGWLIRLVNWTGARISTRGPAGSRMRAG